MKRHIIETICHEVLAHVRQCGEPYVRELPMFDLVRDRLKERDERDQDLTQAEQETLHYLNLIDSKKPDYKWEKPDPSSIHRKNIQEENKAGSFEHECQYLSKEPGFQNLEKCEFPNCNCPGRWVTPVADAQTGEIKNSILLNGGFSSDNYENKIRRSKGKKTRKRPSSDEGKL